MIKISIISVLPFYSWETVVLAFRLHMAYSNVVQRPEKTLRLHIINVKIDTLWNVVPGSKWITEI